jgi:rhodanese-related sulfurtransferase
MGQAFFSMDYGEYLACSPREAYRLCHQGALLIDIREKYLTAFKQFVVPELIFCPFSLLEEQSALFPRNRILVLADSVSLTSGKAAGFLRSRGFESAFSMAGGLVDWEHDGLPLQINLHERLTGSCVCQLRPRE